MSQAPPSDLMREALYVLTDAREAWERRDVPSYVASLAALERLLDHLHETFVGVSVMALTFHLAARECARASCLPAAEPDVFELAQRAIATGLVRVGR